MIYGVSNLQPSDILFFEEYKRLDKLCSDIYFCQNGISEYIAHMERESFQGLRRISSWDSDYKMLKHIRWIRNQIAHSSDTYQMSEQEDLKAVQDYYDRILSGNDALSLLRKAIQKENNLKTPQKRPQVNHVQMQTASSSYTPIKKKSKVWIGIFAGIGILASILLFSHFYF